MPLLQPLDAVAPPKERALRSAPGSELSPGGGRGKLRFGRDQGFHGEVKRRVLASFEQAGLSTRDSPRMYVKTAILALWFGASYAGLVFVAATWWQAIVLACSLAFAAGGISFAIQHDANHGAYSKSGAINRLAGMTLDMLGASSYVWHWKHNIAHHTYTNLNGADSDIDVPFGRISPAQRHHGIHRFQHLYIWGLYSVFVAYWQLFEDFKQVAEGRIAGSRFPRPRGWRLIELIAGKSFFLGWVFVVPMLFHPWWAVLLCYAATSVVLSFILVLVFQLAHSVEEAAHPVLSPGASAVPSAWAVHQVQTTVDFAPRNRLLCWYLGGLNFQIEHHLFPHICHVHYPRIAGIVQATCAEFAVRYTVNEKFFVALSSHWRWLRRMGRPPAPLETLGSSDLPVGLPRQLIQPPVT
jgi:linoleoyl-CoA desaturase